MTANEKLILAKQAVAAQRAAMGRGTGAGAPSRDRLPPGQKLVSGWPVLDLGIQPDVPRGQWRLSVKGLSESRDFSWAEMMNLPQTRLNTDFHCVTSWSIYDAQVEGVLWRDLFAAIKIQPQAAHAMFTGFDGYTTNVSLEELAKPDVAIVHSFGGEPLAREHGGPARIWIPHLYGWKSAKWVRSIEFLAQDKRGFWEVRGYHNHGDPWREERFS